MRNLLVRLLIALCTLSAFSARAVDIDNICYDLDNSGLTATATGWVGGSNASIGDLVIPASIVYNGKKYSVTTIGEEAFFGCSGFTSLTLPTSVTAIGNRAFYHCRGFRGNLVIPNSVTTIGEEAFFGCNAINGYLTISSSVTTIMNSAFEDCKNLSGDLIIPNSVTAIGNRAFLGCSGFKGRLTIGNSVGTIGISAFAGCTGLTGTLTIPESVTTIGSGAFGGCSRLTGTLIIGKSVTAIGDGAFGGCVGFTGSLVIPESVKTIGASAFSGCIGFSGTLNISESVTEIGSSAFSGCTGLTGNLKIPESVTTIGGSAFYGCTGFTGSLVIPESVTTIGDFAFGYCTGFTGSLTIPNSVTNIGTYTFGYCSGLTGNIIIPNSVTVIGKNAFYGCSGFTGSLTIPDSVTEIGALAFGECNGLSGSLIIGNSVSTIGGNAFYGCDGFTILKSLNPTPPELIRNNSGVFDLGISFELPLRVPDESVGAYKAAKGWKKFETILGFESHIVNRLIYRIIPGGGENGDDAVKVVDGHSDSEGALIIPEEVEIDGKKYPVTEIDDSAFEARTDIKKLIIPATVSTIGREAFSGCARLKEVSVLDGNHILTCGDDAFKDAPVKTLYLGRNTSGKPFAGNSSLTDLTIGEKVTAIGSGDFAGCESLKNITVLSSVSPNLPNDGFEQNVYKTAKLSIPDGSVEDYKAASGWNLFFNIRGIDEVMPVAVAIEAESTVLVEGQTTIMKAIITPENVPDKTVTWSTSNPTVAVVDANGLVTAVKSGMATITATTKNGLKAICEVIVLEKTIPATALALNLEEVEIETGSYLQLIATVVPDNATDKTLTWRTSNPNIVTVTTNGLIKGVKSGNATISATLSNGLKAVCEVTVVTTIAALTLNLEKAEMVESSTLQLSASIEPRDATDKTLVWSSSDETVASVDASGLVTALKLGAATITVKASNGISAVCQLTVVTQSTGIDSIESDGAKVRVEGGNIITPEGSEVFDLNGRRVKPDSLKSGIYIIRIPGGKTVKLKV